MKVLVCKTSDVRPESARTIVVQGKSIMVLNDRGVFRAFFNFCPHMGGAVRFDGKKMYCSWHGATFHKESGEAMSAPASEGTGLEPVELVQEGDALYAELVEKKSAWADDF